jgi:ubiquinone biosynthesis protein
VISSGRRYRKVFSILARHGFDDIVGQLSGQKWMRFFRKKLSPEEEAQKIQDRWVRLRQVLEELGPTYIKFGQILSNRPGLLPDDLVHELAKLQDAVPPFPYEEVERILEQEFKQPIAQLFQSIEKVPLATASIAQVHKAVLLSGEAVAVKVQRPGIEEIIRADVEMLRDIAALMMRSSELASLRPKELVAAFERSILEELDFKKEAVHLRRFGELFQDDPHVKIPRLHSSLSSSKVLSLEFLSGIKINRIAELEAAGYDMKLVARRGFDAYFKQIFEWGYFHADPHPGNLLVLPGEVIGILDFGMVGRLSEKDRNALVEFIIGLGSDDTARIVKNIEKLQGSEIEDKPALERDMNAFIEEFGTKAVKDIDLNAALNRGREMINKHRLQLNPDLFLLLRTVSMLEGLGMSLDPEFRSLEIIKPYAFKLLQKNLNPKNLFKSRKLISAFSDLASLVSSFPADARKIVDKLKNDQVKVQIEDKATRQLAREIDQASKRIGNTLVFMTLFAGGCFFSTQSYEAYLVGLNAPALFCFSAAVLVIVQLRWMRRKK